MKPPVLLFVACFGSLLGGGECDNQKLTKITAGHHVKKRATGDFKVGIAWDTCQSSRIGVNIFEIKAPTVAILVTIIDDKSNAKIADGQELGGTGGTTISDSFPVPSSNRDYEVQWTDKSDQTNSGAVTLHKCVSISATGRRDPHMRTFMDYDTTSKVIAATLS
ncbi:uncharacterized protein [Ptychodera flava]|uniref:uncharacterized protein n=1 Tax=Ptychodera flava TaxID=63121 RepID=UPI003969DA58